MAEEEFKQPSVKCNTPRKCPACDAVVRDFKINFEESIVMCTNHKCRYPFRICDELIINRRKMIVNTNVVNNVTEKLKPQLSPEANNANNPSSSIDTSGANYSELDKFFESLPSLQEVEDTMRIDAIISELGFLDSL